MVVGFSESLNLSVAAALVLQKLFFMCPEARGDMPEAERSELRHLWYSRLSLYVQAHIRLCHHTALCNSSSLTRRLPGST